jgi:hypothetical protein
MVGGLMLLDDVVEEGLATYDLSRSMEAEDAGRIATMLEN